jgi:hypothetical protein
MDASKVKKIALKNVRILKRIFGLNSWLIEVKVETIPKEDTVANVYYQPNYRKATVTFDPEKNDDELYLLDSIRHEMIHLMLSDFMNLYEAMSKVVSEDVMELLDLQYHSAVEKTVGNIERMFDIGLKLNTKGLLKK